MPRAALTCLFLAGAAAGSPLLGSLPENVLTLPQRDRFRSSRAPRAMDVSSDGRIVVFESLVPLVPADTDLNVDIYALDRATGRVTLESGSLPAGTVHSQPRVSADGRLVVFESRPPQDDAPRADIVLHDRLTGATRVFTDTGRNADVFGWSRNPDISDDGRMVAFSSASSALTSGDNRNGAREDVYVVHLDQSASGGANGRSGADGNGVVRVSLTSSGTQLENGDSILPSLSADGRWVTFASTAPLDTAAPAAAKSPRHVFLRDTVAGRTIRISRAANGGPPNADSSLPSISADGRFVAFVSEASNVLGDDRNEAADVFLYDRETDSVSWVSRGADGSPAAGESTSPMISPNGRFVAFQSDAGNLVCARRCSEREADINLLWDAFVFNRMSGKTIRVSEDELGGWMEPSAGPALDALGLVVAFSSRHAVDATDRGDDFDLFLRTLADVPAVTRR